MTRGRPPRPTGRDARLVRIAPDVYDLLAADASRLGVSVPARLDTVLRRAALSPEAEAARRPLPPEVLAAGEDEVVHPVKGRGRRVRTSRSRHDDLPEEAHEATPNLA